MVANATSALLRECATTEVLAAENVMCADVARLTAAMAQPPIRAMIFNAE